MPAEADRLDEGAGKIDRVAKELRDENGRLLTYVQDRVMLGKRSWQSPEAERFWERTGSRAGDLRRAADKLDELARKMRKRASELRAEEERARQQAAAAQQRPPRR
jgi:hypothetical protein